MCGGMNGLSDELLSNLVYGELVMRRPYVPDKSHWTHKLFGLHVVGNPALLRHRCCQ